MKKTFKRLLASLMVVTMALTYTPLNGVIDLNVTVSAEEIVGTCGDNLTWTLNTESGELVISGEGEMYNWPYENYAPWDNEKNCIKTVVIKNGVTSIGDQAFLGCSGLTSIALPDSVKNIGVLAFAGCSLATVSIPAGVKEIGNGAFNCANLNFITVDEDNTSYSSDEYGVLFNKTKTILYKYPKANDRTEYTIPETVSSFGVEAFMESTNLKTITVPAGVEIINVGVFSYCSGLESVKLNNGIKYIGEEAFWGCNGLKSIELSNTIKWIDDSAFAGCNKLKSIIIPDSVTSIGNGVFRYCTSLENITIPDSVTSIGSGAFYNTAYYNNSANWKEDILCIDNHIIEAKDTVSGDYVVKDGVKTIAAYAFDSCIGLTSVTFPDGVIGIGAFAFTSCKNIESITIADSVKEIYSTSFNKTAYSNDSKNWDNGVLYIGNHLVATNSNISSEYTIKEGTKTVANYAFASNGLLTEIIIPESVIYIGKCAFEYTRIKSITLPDGITSIDDYAFYNCLLLTSIEIPAGVKYIGRHAFNYNSYYDVVYNLSDVYFKGTEEQWNEIVIETGNKELLNAKIHFNKHECLYTTAVTAPTCTEQGYTTYTCAECGDSYIDNYTDALDHLWGEWTVINSATKENEGLKSRICSVCGTTEEKVMPKIQELIDENTGIVIEHGEGSGVEIKVTEVLNGGSFIILDTLGTKNKRIYDITIVKEGEAIQPDSKVKVRIPLPEGFNENKMFVYYVDLTQEKPLTSIPMKIVGGYIEFETDHFSYYAIVEKLGKVNSVSIDDISVSYKDSVTITPSISVDEGVNYTVSFSSSDDSVATVDANGKVATRGTGNATITVTVTDQYGNTVNDTCNVSVSYKWWQWIIVIVLFGWIWY